MNLDAGDTIIYASETPEMKAREAAGLKRLLDILPEGKGEAYMALWHEFEQGETPDAAFAKAIDRVSPLLHNLYGDGHSWKENNVPKEKVFEINSRIAKGSETLWASLDKKLVIAVHDGLIK